MEAKKNIVKVGTKLRDPKTGAIWRVACGETWFRGVVEYDMDDIWIECQNPTVEMMDSDSDKESMTLQEINALVVAGKLVII